MGTVLAQLATGPQPVILRPAQEQDVPAIVDLLAADQLGATRDGVRSAADLDAYVGAFRAIDRDPAHRLLVAEADGAIVATMQLSFLPGLAPRTASMPGSASSPRTKA